MAIPMMVGQPLLSHITYLDANSQPVVGATFDVVTAHRPDGSTFSVTITEEGNGVYVIGGTTSTNDVPGMWYLLVRGSIDNAYFEETWDVRRLETPTIITQEIQGAGSSRAEIRRAVAAELGDLVVATASKDGERDTVFDEIHLARESRHFDGMQIMCVTGSPVNIGKIARVTASSGENRSVTFTPAFPDKVLTGDTFEMVNRRGMGWTFDQYNRAINTAIQRAGEEHAVIPYSDDITDPVSFRNPVVGIPEAFEYFSGITITDRHGRIRKVPPTDYEIDRHGMTVMLRGATRRRFATPQTIRMHGYVRPGPLLEDTHRTTLPLEWLIWEIKAELESYDVTTGMPNGMRDRLYNMDRQGADGRRISVIGTRAPNTVKLR